MNSEYVVAVKRWPAFVLGAAIIVLAGLFAVQAIFFVRLVHLDRLVPIAAFLVVSICLLAQLALLVWSMFRNIAVVRRPPRLTADGMRLWLFPVGRYVFVPWQWVHVVRVARKGLGTGLFVYVDSFDGVVGGDPRSVRKVQRFARRFLGAPFVYPISTARLDAIDYAVRGYSNGWQALHRG